MAARRQKWSEFRFQENADRVSRDYVSNVGNMRKEMRQRTADEKRRWRVLYTTSDGKPDKRRRPGRAWDPSVLAQPDRQTLNPQVGLCVTPLSPPLSRPHILTLSPTLPSSACALQSLYTHARTHRSICSRKSTPRRSYSSPERTSLLTRVCGGRLCRGTWTKSTHTRV